MSKHLVVVLVSLMLLTACGGETAPLSPAGPTTTPPSSVPAHTTALSTPEAYPEPTRPTRRPTSPPTPAPTRTPRPTPLVVQPTPFAPSEPLPEDLPTVIYAVQRPDQPAQIWTLRYEEGLLEEQLLADLSAESLLEWVEPGYGDIALTMGPAFLTLSADNRYLGVTLLRSGEPAVQSLVIDLVDRSISRVPHPSQPGAYILDWIPGTERLVVVDSVGLSCRVIERDGSLVARLPIQDVLDAVVLPGGERMIFSAVGSEMVLGAVDPTGEDLVVLAPPGGSLAGRIRNLVLSPDGNEVAFTLHRTPDLGPNWMGQLWMMDRDGGNQRPLGVEGRRAFDLAWSPDGSTIVFAHRDDEDSGDTPTLFATMQISLWAIDVESGEERLLVPAEGQYRHWSPRWVAGGSGLVFLSDRGGATNVWFVRADGSDLQQLTRQGGLVGDIVVEEGNSR